MKNPKEQHVFDGTEEIISRGCVYAVSRVLKQRNNQYLAWGPVKNYSLEKWVLLLNTLIGEMTNAELDRQEGVSTHTEKVFDNAVRVAACALGMVESQYRQGFKDEVG